MKIKKIVKRVAISISVLLFFFIGFLMYRDYVSYKDVIHENADNIIKLNIDGLTKSAVYNAITNPSFYLNSSSKSDSIKREKKGKKAFSIPANIFLYTIKNKSETTIFTSFKIANKDDFKNYIKNNYKFEDFDTTQSITQSFSKDKKIIIAFTNTQCVVAYNPSKEDINDVFKDLLINNKSLDKADAKWAKLKDADSHLNYISDNDNLSLDFNSGAVDINGNIKLSSNLKIAKQDQFDSFSNNASLTFYTNLVSNKSRSITHKNILIETDSINKYFKGNFSLEIAGTTTQEDSIVSYEYNDDFEKVETFSVVKKQVPEINIQALSNASKLHQYLESITIVKNGMLNKELFPLYQIKIDSAENSLSASTNLANRKAMHKSKSPEVFALNIDFEKLNNQDHFPMLTSYLEKLLTLSIKGSNKSNENIDIKGNIQLKNKDINALAQFFMNQNK